MPSLRVPGLDPGQQAGLAGHGPADTWERLPLTGFLHNPTEHDSAVLYRRIDTSDLLSERGRRRRLERAEQRSPETPAVVNLTRPGLLTAEGEVVECGLGVPSHGAAWDADGSGLTLPGGWRLDASGCRQTGGGQP